MYLSMKKVYTISKKADKPRLWLQHIVCEAAGFKPGEALYVSVNENEEEITIQNFADNQKEYDKHVSVSSRISNSSGERRPLVDTAGEDYASIVSVKQKVEICVYHKGNKGKVVVRPLRYKLKENVTMTSPSDDRIRVLSICAGAGIGTANLVSTGYFTPVMEIESEEDSAEVLKHNYPNSFLFNGDLRDCHEVIKADLAFVTMPCNEHSSLGLLEGGVMNNLALATAKIIVSSQCDVLFFENVPQFYKSNVYLTLKELLQDTFPYWSEKNIEAWDFGSIARRNRTYAVAFKDREQYFSFQFPAAPNVRRRKLKDFLDHRSVEHTWKDLGKWQDSFQTRDAWKDRNLSKTFVSEDVREIQCIPKRYRSQSASNSYLLNDDRTKWRFFSINELRKILNVPDFFDFPNHTPFTRIYEMLGQSVDGRVIKAIANNIAVSFLKTWDQIIKRVDNTKVFNAPINTCESGQIEFMF